MCIHSAAYEALGMYEPTKNRKPYWWDPDKENDLKEKRDKYQKLPNTKNKTYPEENNRKEE